MGTENGDLGAAAAQMCAKRTAQVLVRGEVALERDSRTAEAPKHER